MSSPTQRTLAKLRKEGWPLVQITERWNAFAKVRQDLFGFVDVLAVKGDTVLAVQTTSGDNVSARFHKMEILPSVVHWLQTPSRKIVIHGWSKRGGIGKRKLWSCREIFLTLDHNGKPVMEGAME